MAGLCVITARTLDHGKELIDFFVDEGFSRLGLIIEVRELVNMLSAFSKIKSYGEAFVRSEDGSGCVVLSFDRDGGITTFSPQLIAGIPGDRGRFIVANVRDVGSLDDVHRLAAHLALADEIGLGSKRCRGECGYFQLCGGGSPAAKFYEHGTFDAAETRQCRWAKKILADVLLDKLSAMGDAAPSAA